MYNCVIANIYKKNRILKVHQAYSMLNNGFWKLTHTSHNLKLRFLRSNAKERLPSYRTCRCLSIRWPNRISNDELWRHTDMKLVEVMIFRRKWVFGSDMFSVEATTSRKGLGRKRGRLKDTFRRSFDSGAAAADTTWLQIKTTAQNCPRYRSFVSVQCASSTETLFLLIFKNE